MPLKKGTNTYLFSVDILIEDETNAKALERLLHLLNSSEAADFKIRKGISLGAVIDSYQAKAAAHTSIPTPASAVPAMPLQRSASVAVKAQPTSTKPSTLPVHERIKHFIAANRLIRLHVNKGLGVKLSIPCRIISFDESRLIMTVYHVDEKQVYAFSLNEIDDFIE